MRRYDILTVRRWCDRHPLWPKKKDGSIYVRPPKKVVDALVEAGKVEFAFSVTEILNCAKNYGLMLWAFDSAKTWACEFIQTMPDFESEDDLLQKASEFIDEKRNEPAGKGTELHKVFEDVYKGFEVSEEHRIMYEMTRALMLEKTGLDIAEMESEMEFGTTIEGMKFGGTIDKTDGLNLIDIKSTNGERCSYLNECSQLVAYNNGETRNGLLANVYIDQHTLKPYRVKIWSQEEKEIGWLLFKLCYKMTELLQVKIKE